MNNTFFWILLNAIILVLYGGFVFFRTRKKSRFQARLAILFFVIMLLPLLSILFLFSFLFIRSINLMAPPGIADILNHTLDVQRADMEQRGTRFFQDHPNWHKVTIQNLSAVNAAYMLVWKPDETYPSRTLLPPESMQGYSNTSNLPSPPPDRQYFMRNWGEQSVFECYHIYPDSARICVGLHVDPQTIASIRELDRLMRNYTAFSLIRDTVLERHIVWLLAMVLSILLAFLSLQLAKSISGGLSGPVLELARGMKIIGDGDLTHKVRVKARDEIGYLVTSFNKMTTELRISRENLKKAERAAAWRDVARQISHEIKNPLTPIELSLYRLKSSVPTDDPTYQDVDAAVRIIEEEITSIRGLAQSFSEFAKMPELVLAEANLAEIIQNSVDLHRDYPISFIQTGQVPLLHVDRERLRRAITNLIKNAIEASPDKKPISIELGLSGDPEHPVKITIADQGTGMTPDVLKKIIKPYYTTKKEGTGLGLFMVDRTIREHGGVMQITSEPGVGTTFTIML